MSLEEKYGLQQFSPAMTELGIQIWKSDGTPTESGPATGALAIDTTNGKIFVNTGTAASATWNDVSQVATAEIDDAAVTLAKLATAVAPSHVVKYAGEFTWSGSGTSATSTVTGALASDIVIATIQSAPSEAGYLVSCAVTADTVTATLSAANTSNDAVIAYQVLRATS